ncbi:uncharacterized protein LOC112152419 [Oryzias melastigma]|uniref:uncharacterized protein LOC112152419 n=1 Tax=Oryzias melastigma TaxID=30732 RepID=UPI00168CF395|nr:uncharacterized protein LOC112152419 [Oryzias melastigma]
MFYVLRLSERTRRRRFMVLGSVVVERIAASPEFITAQTVAEENRTSQAAAAAASLANVQTTPTIKLKPTNLPRFHGCKRSFHRWRKDWESLQKQGEPTGSLEVKRLQLLDSIDEKICRQHRLSIYNTAEDIFRVLENRYGNKTTIALEIIEELEKIPIVRTNQPRKVIDLIQTVEKALADLTELGNSGALKNPLVIKSLESKLPDAVKKDWLVFMVNPANNVTPDNHFDSLLKFLKTQEDIFERLEQLGVSENSEWRLDRKHASTRSTRKYSGCVVCGDGKHREKLFFCKQFKALNPSEKSNAVKKLGACQKCLGCHSEDEECLTTNYLCRKRDCSKYGSSNHHFFLCPNGAERSETDKSRKEIKKRSTFTEEQEKLISGLSPEMVEKFKRAFSNVAAVTKNKTNLVEESEVKVKELPVILMLLEVTANAGQKIGTLIDLASDTNYITHRAAKRLGLESEKITLILHGVGGMSTKVKSRRYFLKIRAKTPQGTEKAHQLICYGLDEIAKVHQVVTTEQLRKFFPEIEPEDLKRPNTIDLLISHREGRLSPQRLKIVGDLVLWDSPLGKIVGGAHPDLFENVDITAHMSETHFARSMRTAAVKYNEVTNSKASFQHMCAATTSNFLGWWTWESIGAACDPKCGGCRCGKCQPGGKEMSLVEEKELEIIKQGLTYVTSDCHSNSPHWDATYPWTVDPSCLPNNRKGVEQTFLRTEKQLNKQPEWKATYTTQIHEMVKRGAAKQLTQEDLNTWKGPVWYVSHLVAPKPNSMSTPVRLVWNSSQKFNGLSMNDLLLKGPDVLNPIRAVLLRFRRGVHAALGDIKKMYNSVWLEEKEMHLHRFLWRDDQEQEIGEYAITRVNMGDRPAGCIAQLAMRETANLQIFTNLEEERRIVEEDSYVDDILTSSNTLENLNENLKGVEQILKAGGFFLKPWILSGQSGRQTEISDPLPPKKENKVLILPNQMKEEENKALGVGYLVKEDKLYVMTAINFSKRRYKIRVEPDLLEEDVRGKTPNPLTRRELLSQVASLYDPIGLVTPTKQKGVILVRKAFQEIGGGAKSKDTWDKPLSDHLREEAIQLFEDYIRLSRITFHRSLTPVGWVGNPCGITFSDGSDKSYGAVVYFRWETTEGVQVRLVESKAKLTPIDQKGDPVKAELCGAVFAARLRQYVEKHSRMNVDTWFHLVDSQTVLGAIQRNSYGYQTFIANRVGEIQKAVPVEDWWWIPGNVNVADCITRGTGPEDLHEDSEWQRGPQFLRKPLTEWPIKSAKEIAASSKEEVNKLQRKSFSSAITRAQAKIKTDTFDDMVRGGREKVSFEPKLDTVHVRRTSAGAAIKKLIDVTKISNFMRLVKVIAWLWKAVETWKQTLKNPKRKQIKVLSKEELRNEIKRLTLTVEEHRDALRDIFHAAQEGVRFEDTTLNRLVVYKDKETQLYVCGGRIQSFDEDKTAVPLLPYNSWVSTLLAREAHEANHEDIAGTLIRMRKRAWVVKGRRLAKKVVDSCVECRKTKAKRCQQIMADLPPERTHQAQPFEFTTVDLFGPYEVKDEVRKRVKLKVWGIIFSCMASRAVHADVVSDQSTEGFLLAYKRFTSIRGHPRKLWSDPGSNFVGAKPVLENLYLFLDRLEKSDLQNEAAMHGTEWSWKIHPADSPHRNGAAEAAVRLLKRALHNLGGDGIFTWGEFQTFLYMAANLTNERPIDARTQSQEDCINYITPNTLLLGRAGPKGDSCSFDFAGYPFKRLNVIQAEVNRFWKKWSQLAGPNLLIRNKWHTKTRNVAVGDIVWIADSNALRGQYRLGRVVKANSDKFGVVRDVKVRTYPSYPVSNMKTKPKESKPATNIPATILHRDVRRIIVILPVEEQSAPNRGETNA